MDSAEEHMSGEFNTVTVDSNAKNDKTDTDDLENDANSAQSELLGITLIKNIFVKCTGCPITFSALPGVRTCRSCNSKHEKQINHLVDEVQGAHF